ncbi:hypothetical protein [Rhodococcus sp. 1168]|uniref:LGFP repeat-containing protein n=1 Tax=Rhodococcus sp. 1168 TaxID=2018041 RepID=UPI0020CAB4F3|nr:hypothetical protein [Rhodococcus sp. 1168]
MIRSTLTAGIRGLLVAGVVGGSALAAMATAQAAPDTGSSTVITVAADCQSYWPSPYQVCGEIKDLYNSLGAAQSALSFPTAAEVTNPDGSKYSTFLGGTIYW